MPLNLSKEEAYAGGQQAADQALRDDPKTGELHTRMQNDFKWARISYLGAAELDLAAELVKFSRERLASDLDLRKYPECRGLRALVEAERQGFADKVDDPLAAAYHFDWYWFTWRRLNTRFVSRTPPPAQCTDFWFAESKEGGPIHGCNLDDVAFRYKKDFAPPPATGPPDKPFSPPGSGIRCIGGVSAAVLCDEEPESLFPVNLDWIMPPGLTDLKEFMAFMERYREFWGPGNRLYVDEDMNFAAVEKANVRVGVRYSSGWAAITACAYLTPEMNAFKKERDELSFKVRAWSNDNSDAAYWAGAEQRYRRLLELVKKEYQAGATLIGAAQITLDHAVPFPARVCLSGEQGHPDEKLQNWTLSSFVECVSGPNRRMLYWVVDPTNPGSIFHSKCHVIPGEGLERRQGEWEEEVAAAGEFGLNPRA